MYITPYLSRLDNSLAKKGSTTVSTEPNGLFTINHNCGFPDTDYVFIATIAEESKNGFIIRTNKVDGNTVQITVRTISNNAITNPSGEYTFDWIAIIF